MTPKSFVSNFLGVIPKNFTFLPAFFLLWLERLLSGYFILISVITET